MDAVFPAAGYGHIELPRKIRVRLVANEDVGEGARHRRGVEELVARNPGHRAADHVADVVHPGLQGHEPDGAELGEDRGHVFEPDPPELELLARGDVGDAAAGAVRDGGDRPELGGVRDPVGDPDPHHEVTGGMASKEDAPPLEPLEVALLDGLPSELGIARDVGADVEAVLLGLDLLDLVHQALLECPKQKRAPPQHTRRGTLASAEPVVERPPRGPCTAKVVPEA